MIPVDPTLRLLILIPDQVFEKNNNTSLTSDQTNDRAPTMQRNAANM